MAIFTKSLESNSMQMNVKDPKSMMRLFQSDDSFRIILFKFWWDVLAISQVQILSRPGCYAKFRSKICKEWRNSHSSTWLLSKMLNFSFSILIIALLVCIHLGWICESSLKLFSEALVRGAYKLAVWAGKLVRCAAVWFYVTACRLSHWMAVVGYTISVKLYHLAHI